VVVADPQSLDRLEELKELVKEELNVKEVRLGEERSGLMTYKVRPIYSLLGKKHGKGLTKVVEALSRLNQSEARGLKEGEPVKVSTNGSVVVVAPEEVEVDSVSFEGYSVAEEPGLLVGIKTVITEELELEGLARDVVRRIQALRKEADFDIDDNIVTYYSGDKGIEKVFKIENEYISEETLSVKLVKGDPPKEAFEGQFDIDGFKLSLGLLRIDG
jgi:isoleucyl-tRNA synthetase